MDVGFSDSQLELRTAVRDVLSRESPAAVVRESIDDPDRWRPLWKTATELGWPALAMLDSAAGMGIIELVAVLEECGATAAPLPLLSSAGLAAGALSAAGPDAQPYLDELSGGAVGALGATRPGGRLPEAPLRWAGDRLTGVIGPVADAARADLLVLLGTTDAGETAAAVVRQGPGLELREQESVDPTRPLAEVVVDVVAEAVFPVSLPDAMGVPLVAAAAELVGVGTRLLDIAVVHALAREQFGKPIGSFQGLKHRLADCYVAVERARSLTYSAAMQLDDPEASPTDRWRAALLAKAGASEAASEAARTAVQVHGAIAMTWEHDVHLYLRRAWQSAALLGESRALYAEAATLLLAAV